MKQKQFDDVTSSQ